MVNEIQAKSILNRLKKRDDWFLVDYSLNPYSACAFNCAYCYIRGSRYGERIPMQVSAKVNAPELLEKQLARRAKKCEYGFVALSSSTEAWQPAEERYQLTRRLLEIILKHRFPVSVCTKSKLVLRDLDLLKEIDKNAVLPADLAKKLKHGVIISFSFSTLDEQLARLFEPGAPTPKERLETLKKCKDAGFMVGANFIPVLPFLSDSEGQLDHMIKTAKEYGADFVFVGGLTLFGKGPADCKTLYYNILNKHYPGLVPKYKSLFRIFFYPPKDYQDHLYKTVARLCEKHGIRNGIIPKGAP